MLNLLALAAIAAPPPTPSERTWEQTLERVTPAVVSIRVTSTRDFDTDSASTGVGTGFVVDAERGIILTNRHMVHPGPVRAEAVFLDNEEVELTPIYRDPIHDFGFYRFDPKAVKYQAVVALDLAPQAARTGLDIRVVGNDAGEKISILDGTLARLDRNAPSYGVGSYNDWNTFYYQAASNTSGGSSGSPVINGVGDVVALNAGGATESATSFYLPLHRVVPALAAIQAGEPVPRGTIQTVLTHTPYAELERLGLRPETEAEARANAANTSGLLVVEEVTPAGPADGMLLPGDILLSVDGVSTPEFVSLEAVLDRRVGATVPVVVERGGRTTTVELPVGDLHAITPSSFLELSRAVVHDLSYQMANSFHRPVRGVFVAMPGFMLSTAGVPGGAVITHVDGAAVPDLDAFQAAMEARADGQRVRLRYQSVADMEHGYETVAVMDRAWFPMRRCTRDDVTGGWPCVTSPPPPAATVDPDPPRALEYPPAAKPGNILASSLVYVDFDIPYPTTGLRDLNYVGVGTVVDAEKGLILVDRDTVPVALGQLMITFGGAVRVPGELVYLHPIHNFAVLRYDPSLLGDLPVRAVEFLDALPQEGETVWQVGLDSDHEVVVHRTSVYEIAPLLVGGTPTPTFRDIHTTGIELDTVEGSLGGVVADKKGRVYALWASYLDAEEDDRTFHGLPTAWIRPVLDPIRAGEEPAYRAPGVEVRPISLAEARDRGMTDARLRQLVAHAPDSPRALEVVRVWGGTPAMGVLRDTDILLAIDGRPVGTMADIEALHDRERISVTLLRDGREQTVELATVPLSGRGVDRVVSWAGLIVHEPHVEVAAQGGYTPRGVYIGWLWYGSPASRYGLRPTHRIIAVNDQPTPDLDAFLRVVGAIGTQGAAVRLSLLDLDDRPRVATLELDLEYWGTEVIERQDGRWVRQDAGSKP